MFDFSHSVRTARSVLPVEHGVKHTHAYEVAAAALGFGSHASYKNSEETFEGADHCIFDVEAARSRALHLGIDEETAKLLIAAFWDAIEPSSNLSFHWSDMALAESLADDLQTHALNSEEVSAASAETNAYFSSISIDHQEFDSDLKDVSIGEAWVLESTGTLDLDQDEDKPFSGDRVEFTVRSFFTRVAGNAIVRAGEDEIGASVDQSPWDDVGDEQI